MTVLMLDPKTVIAEGNIRITSGADYDDLVNSIKRNGVLMPVLVTKDENSSYRLIAGYRRRAAAELVGVKLPAYEIPDIEWDEATTLEAQFAENVFREDITPIEKAQVTLDLQEAGLTQRDVAAATGLPQRSIGAWQKLARADLSEVEGAGELNEQGLLELVGEVDEDFIAPVVTRYLNETVARGDHLRFRTLEDAYSAEVQARKKEQDWAKVRPLLDKLTEAGITIEEGYIVDGRRIINAGSKDAESYGDNAGYIILDLKAHRTETCHRVYVNESNSGVEVTEACTQPKRHTKEDANVQVPDAAKIRKAQTRETTKRKKEREQKAEQNEAYGDYLRENTIGKPDQFAIAVDATERGLHYDWQKDVARWLGLELPDPPEGTHLTKHQLAIDEFTKGMSAAKRAQFIVAVKVIMRHREGAWRYSDDDPTTVISVEAFGKES